MDIWIYLITATTSVIFTGVLGFWLIPLLKRMKYGQTIIDIGPVWHKRNKEGIATMGGIMFIIGISLAFLIGMSLLWQKGILSFSGVGPINIQKAVSGLIMSLCFGFVGFIDDYIKVRKKQNEGLKPIQKIMLQVMIIAGYFTLKILSGDTGTSIYFPFLGSLDFWYFYYVIMGLGILYMINAVNFTDGVDGLCGGVSLTYFASFMIICQLLKYNELSILAAAAAGGCLGFLFWNFNPAKVFMGDTGSMFLGGLVCALGLGTNCEVLMVLTGIIYVWEAISVLIQTTYFKITKIIYGNGKRIFKMTPIHHSLEMSGWSEPKIVFLFAGITALGGVISIVLILYRL
ncbi:MAG: phospho-N-acetylmuramoyl-pentapeptide-transferase [Eubacterium sp.]|jgi:phospho-N-acetylmuramoyl-pentapeptide-transferase|nr:phospho-N-acetylmuramoyl-pentapeptide-transferase [Eubacterium sp.]